MTDTDTRDRVIAQGVLLAALEKKMDVMDAKVTAMHELLLQGKGVARAGRWVGPLVSALVAFAVSQLGGFISFPR
ncbi:hypothetical protein [Microvirga sesbaniae]|uniref:hypothetical protein n=1 Tax=Microvirga sesbaniae TaxID=681392 RepID=UPI0021C77818|nr:hypothetical protein [Microvirga sp. HBU67692]